jgi:glycosyltransferase involved in cell wall biosynthesis
VKVAIVTPTIGSPVLADCLNSVQEQTYENLTHYVFLDGQERFDSCKEMIYNSCGKRTIKTIQLEENVGKGWYGHRVYAACSFLVNADVICYLDEDNWLEPNHVESIVDTFNKTNVPWVYSLRKIYNKNKEFICDDNCESLGKYPVFFNSSVHHIDTSCFAVKKGVAINIGHAWYGQWGADRQFFENVKRIYSRYECTGKYTMCYRLDGNSNSVNEEFFDRGNAEMLRRYNNKLPWSVKNI